MTSPRLTGHGGAPGRDETAHERVDRNWNELLQEMRVTQAGVQIVFGFLLTLPFQPRFASLDASQKGTYLAVLALMTAATALVLAPVMLHRAVFRQDLKARLLATSHHLVQWGMTCLGAALTLGVGLIVSIVGGSPWGLVSGGLVAALVVGLWGVLPVLMARERAS